MSIREFVLFIENRVYKFDVNSHTNIKNLCKMISAAANISNKVFKFTQYNTEINAPEALLWTNYFRKKNFWLKINLGFRP